MFPNIKSEDTIMAFADLQNSEEIQLHVEPSVRLSTGQLGTVGSNRYTVEGHWDQRQVNGSCVFDE